MKQQYVGFGTSSEFLRCLSKDQPVNLECITELAVGNRKYGIRIGTSSIIISQVQGSEVLYFLHPVTKFQTLDDRPMEPDAERHYRRQETAYAATFRWLNGNGFQIRKAMLAMPNNYRRMEGAAEYMRYNKETDSYEDKSQPADPD